MKKYFYHVAFYLVDKSGGTLDDTTVHTRAPINTEEDINAVRAGIKARYGCRGFVVILGFTLLRIEDDEPKEVATL